ncbi:hypothetical protein NPIL_533521 [Nephila pilipes]|uniref:Spider venom protein n=1 Tax=Nephila pilipes TaxID=299642 RepID=A0A8X6QM03_NEPPI|nr:hypothetical protein NPIL_533521 [Nephila pilipes]
MEGGKMNKHFRIMIFIALFVLRPSEGSMEFLHQIQCNGTNDLLKIAPVYTVCAKCYLESIPSPVMFQECISNCFTSTTFDLCFHLYETNRTRKESIREMIHTFNTPKILEE